MPVQLKPMTTVLWNLLDDVRILVDAVNGAEKDRDLLSEALVKMKDELALAKSKNDPRPGDGKVVEESKIVQGPGSSGEAKP